MVREKELKLEDGEARHTLVGAGEEDNYGEGSEWESREVCEWKG